MVLTGLPISLKGLGLAFKQANRSWENIPVSRKITYKTNSGGTRESQPSVALAAFHFGGQTSFLRESNIDFSCLDF